MDHNDFSNMIDKCDDIIVEYIEALNLDYGMVIELREEILEELRFRIDAYIVNEGY